MARPEIARVFFAHLEPFARASETGAFSHINASDDVWPHAKLSYVVVIPQEGALTLELGYQAEWDEDHTLGARFRDGKLVELDGSTAPL